MPAARRPSPRAACAIVAGLVVATGCYGSGPNGPAADSAFLASVSYLLEYRSHFFPAEAEAVCLEGPRAEAEALVRSFLPHHLPVRANCGAEPEPLDERLQWAERGQVVRFSRGEQPIRWTHFWDGELTRAWYTDGEGDYRESFPAMIWRVLRARPYSVAVPVEYADPAVRSARFLCDVTRTSGGWQVEECVLEGVEWTDGRRPAVAEFAGCWELDWEPVHLASTEGLPSSVRLTTLADTVGELVEKGFMVLPAPGSPDDSWVDHDWGEHWASGGEEGWRWGIEEGGFVLLRGGGIFEGIDVRMVHDPQEGTLRGPGTHWTDAIASPRLPDPDWTVLGREVPCRDGEG